MTDAKLFEKRLKACLEQTERTQQVGERLIAHIRRLTELIDDEDEKETCHRQIRHLQSIVRSCENEAATLKDLLRRVRGDAQTRAKSAPPPPPTTIRVFVPKGLQIPDDVIKRLVLQTLNGYGKETETRKAD